MKAVQCWSYWRDTCMCHTPRQIVLTYAHCSDFYSQAHCHSYISAHIREELKCLAQEKNNSMHWPVQLFNWQPLEWRANAMPLSQWRLLKVFVLRKCCTTEGGHHLSSRWHNIVKLNMGIFNATEDLKLSGAEGDWGPMSRSFARHHSLRSTLL